MAQTTGSLNQMMLKTSIGSICVRFSGYPRDLSAPLAGCTTTFQSCWLNKRLPPKARPTPINDLMMRERSSSRCCRKDMRSMPSSSSSSSSGGGPGGGVLPPPPKRRRVASIADAALGIDSPLDALRAGGAPLPLGSSVGCIRYAFCSAGAVWATVVGAVPDGGASSSKGSVSVPRAITPSGAMADGDSAS